MRLGILLAALLAASAARADADGGDAWTDFAQQESALENTSTSDCATACKALESLARAAEHICAVAPEHCDEARARVRAATDRVHAACPQCTVGTATVSNAPQARAENQSVEVVAASRESRGGCAGCATAGREPGAGLALLSLATLLLLAGIRRR